MLTVTLSLTDNLLSWKLCCFPVESVLTRAPEMRSYLGFGLMAGRAAVLSHEEALNANPCIPTGHSVRCKPICLAQSCSICTSLLTPPPPLAPLKADLR